MLAKVTKKESKEDYSEVAKQIDQLPSKAPKAKKTIKFDKNRSKESKVKEKKVKEEKIKKQEEKKKRQEEMKKKKEEQEKKVRAEKTKKKEEKIKKKEEKKKQKEEKGKKIKEKKKEKKPAKKEQPVEKPEIIVDYKITELTDKGANIRTGFGWKGLGGRKIYLDSKTNNYIYDVIEPPLTKDEKDIKDKLTYFFRVRADADVTDFDERSRKSSLKASLDKIVKDNNIKLTEEAKDKIYYYIFQEFIGYGKIDILMKDEGIEDISCDGINVPLFIFHKDYESIKSNVKFTSSDELDSFVVKLSQMCGKQISVYEPVVDGKLEDGSRLQTTLSRTITKYSTFTIRRFREDPLTPIDLVENNTMSLEMAAYFWLVIEKGTSILFCGGTAAGKTTALNALSLFLPSTFKIVSIEDTREINLPHENWIAGTTRTGFASTEDVKTSKDIDMFDLIRVALRQRPRVIIVGEVRGKEAYTLFQAMTTGHLSYSTVHASDMHTLIQRLESKPIDLPRALLTSLDLIIFLNSVTVKGNPVRRITNVTEILRLDPESNRLVTITPFKWESEIKDTFENNSNSSKILQSIKVQYGWNNQQFKQEIENRKKILKWMMKKNLRSYEDVGRIVAQYLKEPEKLLKRVNEDK